MSSQTGAGARWIRALISLLVILVAFGAAWFIPPRLGLDLSGGTQIVLETQDGPDGTAADSENTDKVVEVLRQRIDRLGVAEANMSRSGENRIIVELPGVQDPAEAAQIVGQTAQLSFHPVLGVGESGGQGVQAPPQGGDFANPPADAPADASIHADEARAPADAEGEAPAGGGGEAPAGGEGGEMTQEEMEELLGGMEGAPGGGAPGGGGMPQAPAGPPAENPEDVAVTLPDSEGNMLQLGDAAIQGDRVSSAEAGLDQVNRAQWVVNVGFRGEGRDQWQELTGQAACFQEGDPRRRVAIVLDDQIISSPQVTAETACEAGMAGGQTTISGDFNSETAEELAVLIEGGSLPLPVTEVQRQTVGPTLGAAAIQASAVAAILGIAFTALYITLVYRMVGFLASIALAFYTLIAYGALVAISATLTLPGLAGFVLAIGMAIDANVLIFERAREEYQRQQQVYEANKASGMKDAGQDGKETGALARRKRRAVPPSLEKAFVQGTQKAWSAVLDTNVTTILAAALLFFFASGTVQGFGVTLSLGTIASMISALVIARVFVEWAVRRTVIKKHPSISGIDRIGKVRTWLVEKNPKLMNFRRVGLIVAALIVVTAIAAPLVRDTNLGVEFTGGRVLEYEITGEQDLSIDEARGVISGLDFAGSDTAVVQESGDSDLSVRTGDISDAEASGITDALTEETGGVEMVSDELIGPSMGDELRNRALIALAGALALQMAYLAWRFRWSFGVSTMLSLAFNMMLVIGLFIWLGKPIDGVFLAAILSVIGFTVNDSVVVFDRVRDEWAKDDKSTFIQIANRAILNTLPRTVNTTVGAWIILIFLTFLGGSSLQDFSIAMLVGLTTGVVSTVFVAVPIAIWLQKWDKTPAPHVIKERKAKQKVAAKAAREADDGAVV
ncbi:protein translocase subunit SecD [Nocardiopsis sp. JB363]|uniref:protein translocase subunit SecD n=1 Tax=Nocardiopsis sp. JB363 TaxID=1434837 RepID=UPI00097AD88E|nr:protein translocase subunit SecD [Nocardiopsis sp. JB363]SIO84812.1 Protein-export membrane protein SecD (TC 3.A.5.1.1) / Protein-export membrane protein SecF (TC 3.A.5.1.1) [Nocardiopsis sp. JB363]